MFADDTIEQLIADVASDAYDVNPGMVAVPYDPETLIVNEPDPKLLITDLSNKFVAAAYVTGLVG